MKRRGRPLNLSRMADCFSKPGIDPRKWISFCTVTGNPVAKQNAIYISSIVQPDGIPVTLRVEPDFVGDGFGMWTPLEKGTTVLAAFPDGSYDAGGVIIKRVHDDNHKVPDEIQGDIANIWLVANKDINIIAEDGHQVTVKSGESEVSIQKDKVTASHKESEVVLREGSATIQKGDTKAVLRDAGVSIKASLINLETTGDINTSKVFIDNINFNAMYQTAVGPTIGPPVPNPTNPNAMAIIQYKVQEAIEEGMEQ